MISPFFVVKLLTLYTVGVLPTMSCSLSWQPFESSFWTCEGLLLECSWILLLSLKLVFLQLFDLWNFCSSSLSEESLWNSSLGSTSFPWQLSVNEWRLFLLLVSTCGEFLNASSVKFDSASTEWMMLPLEWNLNELRDCSSESRRFSDNLRHATGLGGWISTFT